MSSERPAVDRQDVERLWNEAITGACSLQATSERAEALISEVNSASPVIEDGLQTLYYAHQDEKRWTTASLIQGRTRWRSRLAEYDADPELWMRDYFARMVSSHARWQGVDAARRFGRKLVARGELDPATLNRALAEFEAPQSPHL